MEDRFQRTYSAHLLLLKGDLREEMMDIGEKIEI